MKKVIFLMIDSFMPHVLNECISQGRVPALKFFKEKGFYWEECTTVFPTMTASVDCSLITGEYPDKHKIPALIWYEPDEMRLVNYTNGAWPVLKLGIKSCAQDAICHLNDKHLSKEVRSIYEELSQRGKSTGSINLIAHRSIHKYKVKLPFLLRIATGFCTFEDVSGPEVFSLGAVSRSKIDPPLPWKWDESLFGYYGISDKFAIRLLNHLIKHDIVPDFTMVYLPDNDHQVHLHPRRACEILSKVDKQLQKMLNQFSSWEEALSKFVFIITGDHGQTIVGKTEEHNILLEDLLAGIKIASYGEKVLSSDQLVIANNERMTYLYPLKEEIHLSVIERLARDQRIDIIAWKQGNSIVVKSGITQGTLQFKPEGNYTDVYGKAWFVEGKIDILDLDIADDIIKFGQYPDALSRLYGALFSQEIQFIVCTAKPGFEFKSAFAPTHLGGGSHGSLHKQDSTIPLIISGVNDNPLRTQFPRLVDMKNVIMNLLL